MGLIELQLRVMNRNGTESFRSYLRELKEGKITKIPEFDEEEYSQTYPVACDLDRHLVFGTKLEFGKYINQKFTSSKIKREEVTANAGIWTWLAYFWFTLLTTDNVGKQRIGEDYRYIFSDDFRTHYRHLVWLPYDMIALHGENASRLFLYGEIPVQGDFIEQVASRLDLYSNTAVVDSATRLYFDQSHLTGKRGAQSRTRPGNVRRFVTVLKQLNLTYDLYSTSSIEIIDLLPKEFEKWKQ